MRCGGAAPAALSTVAISTAAAPTIRLSQAAVEPLFMPSMSHCVRQWAMTSASPPDEQPFSHLAVCRVSLEVALGIHDIFGRSERALRPRKGDRMANWQDPQTTGVTAATVSVPRAARDVGLRSYMLSVYNYMASGVLLTGIISMLFANSSLINLIVNPATGQATPLFWIALFAPLGIVFALSFGINRISARTAQMLFWLYAALVGVQFSSLFLVYTGASIAQAFFATAAAFLGLSLYGYTTKRDLSGFGTFLIMGVVGLFAALLINMFLRSPALDLGISAIGVLIFAGLTVYDTQKIKSIYFAVAGNGEAMAKSAVMGALNLYPDFLNMFLFLLRFAGNRR